MVGMPLVLRDEENYRKIAELYGRTVDDRVFSWDGIDISAGYCLFLTEIGNRIDEGVNLAWKNRVYPVWVSEGGDSQAMHVPKTTALEIDSAHATPVVMGSPGGPPLRVQQDLDCSNHIGPISELGHTSAFNSKKRPRRFRSPEVAEMDLGPTYSNMFDEVISNLPFPDLNFVVPDSCPSTGSQPAEDLMGHSPMEETKIGCLSSQQIKDALKVSGPSKGKPPIAPSSFKKGQRGYSDFETMCEGPRYPYTQPGSSSSTPAWDFNSNDPHHTRGTYEAPRQSGHLVLEDEDEPKEWMAQVEAGVQITFVSLPDGGNDLKRIRFNREMFNKWQAQRW
ncbi:hypothetical protein L1987_73777 [Smallanthus sonchifolius]|uniref:Uncharacterized protein n=1 Tax=Smallanthus sonchifolius TaxID=185202 RepID=A0ACB9A181_9ASTR|nr:hypothetical protein L1987_73777 [Smallanthus sonchifolius]